MQLAETRIRDFGGQRETLVRQYDEAERQRQSLERESEASDDDGGAALDAARETVSRLQDELNAVEARRREVDGRIISLQAKADALKDTLDSRNASGSLERDASLETMGRLTDFIRVAEGWEEGVARALSSSPVPWWCRAGSRCCMR